MENETAMTMSLALLLGAAFALGGVIYCCAWLANGLDSK